MVTDATMNDISDRPDRAAWTPVSRRQALAGIGTLAAGGGAGVAVLGSMDTARAQVAIDDWRVPDASLTAKQADPEVVATVQYDYDAGTEAVEGLAFDLLVGGEVIAEERMNTSVSTHNGTVDLSGRVTDAAAWAADDFAPAVASSVSRNLTVGVQFRVLGSGDGPIVSAEATDTATLVIQHPQKSTVTASVGGSAEIVTADD